MPILSQDTYDAIKGNRLHIFTLGKILYCDVFGKEHWTKWCYRLTTGGGYATCETENDSDTNPEPPRCPLRPR